MSDSPRLFSIASGQPFLDHLARTLFDEAARTRLYGECDLSDVQVLLPTRRAARELANLFLQLAQTQGTGALLLPRIETLGDIEEDAPQAGRDRKPKSIKRVAKPRRKGISELSFFLS